MPLLSPNTSNKLSLLPLPKFVPTKADATQWFASAVEVVGTATGTGCVAGVCVDVGVCAIAVPDSPATTAAANAKSASLMNQSSLPRSWVFRTVNREEAGQKLFAKLMERMYRYRHTRCGTGYIRARRPYHRKARPAFAFQNEIPESSTREKILPSPMLFRSRTSVLLLVVL